MMSPIGIRLTSAQLEEVLKDGLKYFRNILLHDDLKQDKPLIDAIELVLDSLNVD